MTRVRLTKKLALMINGLDISSINVRIIYGILGLPRGACEMCGSTPPASAYRIAFHARKQQMEWLKVP